MNKENINKLADFIEAAEYVFDMTEATAAPGFGTAGCIGGHAAVLWPDIRSNEFIFNQNTYFSWDEQCLADKLGISHSLQFYLCFPADVCSLEAITRTDALRTLRHLAETGKVDWSHVE